MWYFFRQVEDFSSSTSALNAEVAFRDRHLSGLLEKRMDGKTGAVMVFASGTPAGAYLLQDNSCQPIGLAEFTLLDSPAEQGHRAIQLPNRAMRLVWLSLESQVQDVFTIPSDASWQAQVRTWQNQKWSGLVEVRAEDCHGLALFWDGAVQTPDVFFSSARGFGDDLFHAAGPRQVVTFGLSDSAQAYQCAVLRQGATHWSNKALGRYRDLVGQKLLRSLERELNRQIQPWNWDIYIEDGALTDGHFFLHTDYAAHAYRAILMSMGGQMNFVIGNNLTQKLLSETFASVPVNETTQLQAHRLIPAAFSE